VLLVYHTQVIEGVVLFLGSLVFLTYTGGQLITSKVIKLKHHQGIQLQSITCLSVRRSEN
jgi:hypothetical protein